MGRVMSGEKGVRHPGPKGVPGTRPPHGGAGGAVGRANLQSTSVHEVSPPGNRQAGNGRCGQRVAGVLPTGRYASDQPLLPGPRTPDRVFMLPRFPLVNRTSGYCGNPESPLRYLAMPLVATDRIDVLKQLRHAIDHAAHLLPAQGPITVFIHHNTLHALEDLPFTEAVKRGATVFGCQPYLTRSRYREELRRGRIRFADLEAILRENLGVWAEEKVLGFCTRLELRLAMLQYPVPFGPTEELLWFVAERNALRRIRG